MEIHNSNQNVQLPVGLRICLQDTVNAWEIFEHGFDLCGLLEGHEGRAGEDLPQCNVTVTSTYNSFRKHLLR